MLDKKFVCDAPMERLNRPVLAADPVANFALQVRVPGHRACFDAIIIKNFQIGFVDDDFHAQSPCVPCLAGTYAGVGTSGQCLACDSVSTDDDADSSTLCKRCPAGTVVPILHVGMCQSCEGF